MRHRASRRLLSSPSTLALIGSSALVVFVACGGTGTSDDNNLSGPATGTTGGTESSTGGHSGTTGKSGNGGTKAGSGGTTGFLGGSGGGGGSSGNAAAGAGGGTSGSGGTLAGPGGTSSAGAAGTSSTGGASTGGSGGTSSQGGTGQNAGGTTSAGTGGVSFGGTGAGAMGGTASSTGGSGTAGTGQPSCIPTGNANNPDQDSDGYTVAQGDCNDCDPNVNPGAVDVLQTDMSGNPLPNQTDNDCDGVLPTAANQECGDGLAIDSNDPMDAAKAMDICRAYDQNKRTWGVDVANSDWETAAGVKTALPKKGEVGHGILTAFGSVVKTQLGPNMLAVSSGTARQPTDPGYQDVGGYDKGYTSAFLPGFPIESPACPGVTTGMPHDSVMLRLTLHVPTNAHSFSFNFKFYTYEFPDYICSEFNDFFVVLMSPPPSDVDPTNLNITFDSMKNPISVNNAFLDVCTPQMAGGKNFPCMGNVAELNGTGFEGHGATSWLKTTASVTPGSTITLAFAAWDSGDGILDSTGIIDNFRWSATPAMGTVTEKP